MTARTAVQRLVQDGLVYRLPGRGTFVADHGAHRHARRLTNFTDELRRKGRVPSSRIVDRVQRPATPRRGGAASHSHGSGSSSIHRLRLADAHPVALELADRCGAMRLPAVLAADLEQAPSTVTLADAGLIPTSGRATLGSEPAGESRGPPPRGGEGLAAARRAPDDPRSARRAARDDRDPLRRRAIHDRRRVQVDPSGLR